MDLGHRLGTTGEPASGELAQISAIRAAPISSIPLTLSERSAAVTRVRAGKNTDLQDGANRRPTSPRGRASGGMRLRAKRSAQQPSGGRMPVIAPHVLT
jgi:hypothetical protein